MFKLKSFLDLDKEEAWLSDLSAEGWYLSKRNSFGGYTFFQADQGRLTYRIDYREFKRNDDYLDYLALFDDAGWIHVAGTRWSGNQYFVPKDMDASKELFSDNASKAARYRRIASYWISLALIYMVFFVSAAVSGAIDIEAMLNPAELYYTPGLWQKEGLDFVRAFLFETPFALGRGFFWLAFPLFFAFCLYYILKTRSLAKKTVSSDE